MRAVVSGCMMLGRLLNVCASGPEAGDTTTIRALLVDKAIPLCARAWQNSPTAHCTGSLRVSAEPWSTISAIAFRAGAACENPTAVTDAVAVVSFRKVRRVVLAAMLCESSRRYAPRSEEHTSELQSLR